MRFLFSALISSSFSLATVVAQDDPAWHDTYAAGAEQAKEEDKDILLVLTGTDWIEICEVFNREILTQPEFIETVSKEFALVKLEFPQDNKLPRQEATRKQFLRDAYQVRGFPTVVLTTAEGRPFGFNGYQPVSPEEYAEMTMSMHAANDEAKKALAAAENLEGLAKAESIASGIPQLPGSMAARFYRKNLDEAIAADPDATLQATKSFQKMIADVEYGMEMQKLERDVQYGKMIELTENFIAGNNLEGAALQKALMIKASVQQKQANTAGTIQTWLDVVKIDPDTVFGQQAQERLDKMRAEKLQQELAP